jgi:hypothetical protein
VFGLLKHANRLLALLVTMLTLLPPMKLFPCDEHLAKYFMLLRYGSRELCADE